MEANETPGFVFARGPVKGIALRRFLRKQRSCSFARNIDSESPVGRVGKLAAESLSIETVSDVVILAADWPGWGSRIQWGCVWSVGPGDWPLAASSTTRQGVREPLTNGLGESPGLVGNRGSVFWEASETAFDTGSACNVLAGLQQGGRLLAYIAGSKGLRKRALETARRQQAPVFRARGTLRLAVAGPADVWRMTRQSRQRKPSKRRQVNKTRHQPHRSPADKAVWWFRTPSGIDPS
jgi:hypothetical protein